MNEFDMFDLGRMKYFLGIEVLQRDDGIFICQKKYAMEVLRRFGMEESNSVLNPVLPGFKVCKDADGVMVDATFFKQVPTELHLHAAKRALRYLRGTTNFGIFYMKGGSETLVAYADSEYTGDLEDKKSTSGYVFLMSSGAVSWSSKKYPIVTLSTVEAEFVAAAYCASQVVWMRRILEELGHS
ncbi:secreted RxLR effector protein 161-like [Magnolia sinica]|uniref:secreted RxLR effector protein 161-like n=1 Tax=Magnolia sinica TaxID=86752 RepID=UPI0026594132|nr:secreted RxLR effector protein 161-like [Magnolia sinica]